MALCGVILLAALRKFKPQTGRAFATRRGRRYHPPRMRAGPTPAASAPRSPSGPRHLSALPLLLVLAVLATFWPASRNGFLNYDDDVVIFRNAQVTRGLDAGTARWALTSLEGWNWLPVTRLAHLLNATLFGMRPGPHHLTSIAGHALAAALLWLALLRLTGRPWPAFFVAALFALHPQRVESVAWAAELKDPLSGVFFSLTLLAYAAHARRPGALRLALVVLLFALGLMAKPTLVPLPLLLLALDRWPLRRLGKRAVLEKAPLLLLSAGASAVTLFAQAEGRALSPLAVHSVPARLGNALTAVASYLGSFAWPSSLAVIYPHRGDDFPPGLAAAGGLLLLGLSVLALRQADRRPWLGVGWLWFLAFLAPVIGLVQAGLQSMADRYTYLPLIGVALALAWTIDDSVVALRLPRIVPAAAAAALLAALAAVSWRTCGYWSSDSALFGRAVKVVRDNGPALANFGAARAAEGRLDEAEGLLRRSVALLPNYGFTHLTLGNVLHRLGRDAEALASYRTALRLAPGWAEAHNNLGASLVALGRFKEAAPHFRAALATRPEMSAAAENLARIAPLLGR